MGCRGHHRRGCRQPRGLTHGAVDVDDVEGAALEHQAHLGAPVCTTGRGAAAGQRSARWGQGARSCRASRQSAAAAGAAQHCRRRGQGSARRASRPGWYTLSCTSVSTALRTWSRAMSQPLVRRSTWQGSGVGGVGHATRSAAQHAGHGTGLHAARPTRPLRHRHQAPRRTCFSVSRSALLRSAVSTRSRNWPTAEGGRAGAAGNKGQDGRHAARQEGRGTCSFSCTHQPAAAVGLESVPLAPCPALCQP